MSTMRKRRLIVSVENAALVLEIRTHGGRCDAQKRRLARLTDVRPVAQQVVSQSYAFIY